VRLAAGIGGSVIAADCGVQTPFIRAATCAAAPSVIAGQYATSNFKRCWSGFPVSGGT